MRWPNGWVDCSRCPWRTLRVWSQTPWLADIPTGQSLPGKVPRSITIGDWVLSWLCISFWAANINGLNTRTIHTGRCFTAAPWGSETRVHQQNTLADGGVQSPAIGTPRRPARLKPVIVLPFEYGVPELVKR